jgi:hypothetical protein
LHSMRDKDESKLLHVTKHGCGGYSDIPMGFLVICTEPINGGTLS